MTVAGQPEGGVRVPKRRLEVTLYVEQSPGNWTEEETASTEYEDEKDAKDAFRKKKEA
jgi:hypothetical protein